MCYTLVAEYRGNDHGFDKLIRKASKTRSDSSGFSFIDGFRDITFSFKSYKLAIDAKRRIRKELGRKKNLNLYIY